MIRPLLALAALTLGAAALTPIWLDTELETLPPSAAELHSALSASGANLLQQVAAAEKAVGGQAIAAKLDPLTGDNAVRVLTSDKAFEVVLTKDGTVTSQTEMPRFPGAAVTGDWTETPSGLKYYDIKRGAGPSPASNSSRVSVHYSGWLLNGVCFDSSVERGKPLVFALNRVIPGWTEGLSSMQVGGKRKLIVPAIMGYGDGGNVAASIPPHAILVFDVELLEIID